MEPATRITARRCCSEQCRALFADTAAPAQRCSARHRRPPSFRRRSSMTTRGRLGGTAREKGRPMGNAKTIHEVTYDLLRELGLTTVFGNPGSTEETFLTNFPDDFTYVLGLRRRRWWPWPTDSPSPPASPPWSMCTPPRAWETRWATWWRRPRATPR